MNSSRGAAPHCSVSSRCLQWHRQIKKAACFLEKFVLINPESIWYQQSVCSCKLHHTEFYWATYPAVFNYEISECPDDVADSRMSCAFQEAGAAKYLSWPLLELRERSPCIIKLFLDLLFVVILVALGSIPERLLKDSKQAVTCWVALYESWHEAEVEPLPRWALFALL